jgi:transcription elongation factor Elf1
MKEEEEKMSGFNCPNCDAFVEISIKALLSNANLSCANCKTKFEMEKKKSEEALDVKQNMDTVIDHLKSEKGKMNN